MNDTLYAIWKYDMFPFVLIGEIDEIVGDKAKLKSFNGGTVTPLKIYSKEEGEKISKMLKDCAKEYDSLIAKTTLNSIKKVEELLKINVINDITLKSLKNRLT